MKHRARPLADALLLFLLGLGLIACLGTCAALSGPPTHPSLSLRP